MASAEQELERRRTQLDADRRSSFDVQTKLVQAQTELARIEQATDQAAAVKGPTIEVKTFHTPLSKTVMGNEIHFQLLAGRVAYLPIEELFELAKQETRDAHESVAGADAAGIHRRSKAGVRDAVHGGHDHRSP